MENKISLPLRSELPSRTKRIVVKVGSQAITFEKGGVDQEKIKNLVKDLATLYRAGLEVILVSSGAIQSGLLHLPPVRHRTIDYLQACSAIGQPLLMKTYLDLFSEHGIQCAQVLLTHDDLKNRTRYLNARHTLQKLLQQGILPILNENDSVSFAEISLGDNDQLAAMVTELMEGDALLLLTGPDGLFNQDPSQISTENSPGESLMHYKSVPYDENFEEVKLLTKSKAGRGGMKTKLMAVRKLTPLGIGVIMSTYKDSSPILRALTQSVGSFFLPAPLRPQSGRKTWLLTLVKNQCYVEIDEGANMALLKGSSLLPSGIKKVEGTFKRGDCIGIMYKKRILAVGLTEYDAGQIKLIMGKKAQDIFSLLGEYVSEVVIHRDNLALKPN